jgi:hypothetical protein
MTFLEKVIFFVGFVFIWGFPLVFLIFYFQLFLLIAYLLTVTGFFVTLRRSFCSQCMNFACPLNRVKFEVRRDFFELKPEVAKAWDIDK